MALSQTFRKAGGIDLIANWFKAGVLPYVLFQILLTGTSKKSLEMVRNGVYLKINKKLSKRYKIVLDKFDSSYTNAKQETDVKKYVWFCWMQGIEEAPALVRKCYESVCRTFQNRTVILLTEENILDYADIPSFIMEKYKVGIITRTHFSDLLRIALLSRHGGTWIDATVFCRNVPDYMLDSDFFVFQNLKPGADGSVINCSSWFMTAKPNNHLVLAIRELLWAYWEKENRLIDYFLLHHFMMIVSQRYLEEWNKIPKYPNSLPHVLLLGFFEDYDKASFDRIIGCTPVHKLSYKFSEEQVSKSNTNYKQFMDIWNTKDIPAGEMWAGNPAKFIKKRQ